VVPRAPRYFRPHRLSCVRRRAPHP
jgi:hypothetical protein